MIRLSRLPKRVTDFLYRFKPQFRGGQVRHHLIFCWVLVAMILVDQGRGTLKGMSRVVPARISYWAMLRMIRSGWWDGQMLIQAMVGPVLAWLPAPADGVLYLIGDSTVKRKRGKQHPLGRKTRLSQYSPYVFGFGMVLLIASWGSYRVPVAIAVIDPEVKGHQNILFRQMLRAFVPPSWARQVVVVADAGFAAKATLKQIQQQQYDYVFAVARTWKLADGTHLRNLVRHLPRRLYQRVASFKPDGRRKDYWVFRRRASLKYLGDVTILLSKKRRNDGPKATKIIVTNLTGARAGRILSIYARRWGIEVTIKELKGGLHLGRMQVTGDPDRVARSVALSVLAYLLLLRLYGRDASLKKLSLFRMKQKFVEEVYADQWQRSEHRWRKKLDQYRRAA